MGFRFRRTLQVVPGVRLNISKSGVSASVGPRGAKITVGRQRPRVTVGLPGTGLSHTALLGQGRTGGADRGPQIASQGATPRILGLVVIIALALVVGLCSRERGKPAPKRSMVSPAPAALLEPPVAPVDSRFVNVDRLNVRGAANGPVVGSLTRGEPLQIHESRDGWSRISADGEPPRWVSSSRLCSGEGCAKLAVAAAGGAALAATAMSAAKTSPPPSSHPKTARVPSHAAAPPSTVGVCPCSGASNCVGPRGGSYCITSSGRKRYR